MRKIFTIILVLMSLTTVVFSQEEKKSIPVALQIATPIYPQPAIALNLEEKIFVQIKIDKEGKVISTSFDRGAKFFHAVIKDALNQWRFEKSNEKKRQTSINFIFILLPYNSKSFTSTIFHSPDTVEVFARKIKIINTVDNKTQQ